MGEYRKGYESQMLLKTGILFSFLFLAPAVLGLPWIICLPVSRPRSVLACIPFGYFIELALFHFLSVPFAFLGGPFSTLAVIFICVICSMGIISIAFYIKHRQKTIAFHLPKFTRWEMFYLLVFIVLVLWQMYNGITRDITIWSYDDAGYVTYGADTVRYNQIQSINAETGLATANSFRRTLQSSLYYPAFLSLITEIPNTVMNRTILEAYDIFLAYTVYAYMAGVICKKKENGLVFLIILSVLHVFGYYSQYSVTFRLLGPNYQGKAVLAVSLFPLLFTVLLQKLETEYDRKTGILLLLFSSAATALTMFGAATYILNLSLVVGLSLFRRKRHWKHLWYLVWGCILPAIYLSIYFIYKYIKW